jgi:glutathione synthase/RimK-type ligase-like ATP-grasp enzyme
MVWLDKLGIIGKNIATLLLLSVLLPFNLTWVILTVLLSVFRRRSMTSSGKTIMVSGGKMTKALHLARAFHRRGHRVILLETHKYWLIGNRFSWCIDRFYTVPDPRSADYAESLLAIVLKEKVDVYVPVCSPVASYYDAKAIDVLQKHCQVFQPNPEIVTLLDDKYQFIKKAEELGLNVPRSFIITDRQQVLDFDFSQEKHPFILKSIKYDAVRRLNLTKLPCQTKEETIEFVNSLPISSTNPWIMQEFITGQEYCTHSTVKDGELRVHCCCQSSAFQVNYQYVEHPEIKEWVSTFIKALGLTGQISFDFIQSNQDGKIYPIECNPRTHSAITMFYNHPDLADAYLAEEFSKTIVPLPNSLPTYWLYHELWRLFTHLFNWQEVNKRLNIILYGKEAIFSFDDPLPFLMVYHWQIPLLILRDLIELRGWIRIDFNIGKLVQLDGD